MKFFKELSAPDASGSWFFPNLRTVEFHEDDACKNIPASFLAVLLEFVRSRLSCKVTDTIYSVRLKCCQVAANSVYANALVLLVPDSSILTYGNDEGDDSEAESWYSY